MGLEVRRVLCRSSEGRKTEGKMKRKKGYRKGKYRERKGEIYTVGSKSLRPH